MKRQAKREEVCQVRLEAAEVRELDRIAAEQRNTRSGIIRLAVAQFLRTTHITERLAAERSGKEGVA